MSYLFYKIVQSRAKPVYVITIFENFSRAVLSSAISVTQNQWDYLVRRVGAGKISLKERGG